MELNSILGHQPASVQAVLLYMGDTQSGDKSSSTEKVCEAKLMLILLRAKIPCKTFIVEFTDGDDIQALSPLDSLLVPSTSQAAIDGSSICPVNETGVYQEMCLPYNIAIYTYVPYPSIHMSGNPPTKVEKKTRPEKGILPKIPRSRRQIEEKWTNGGRKKWRWRRDDDNSTWIMKEG